MPAVPASIIEPVWDQFAALLPAHDVAHPLGCHRQRISDRVVVDKLVQVLAFGCAYARMADATCSASTVRRRRDEWIAAGVLEALHALALAADDRMIGLAVEDVVIDCCITKAPCGGEVAGRSPGDRGTLGLTRSVAVDAAGIPLATIAAPANRHDSPLLEPTRAAGDVGAHPTTVHLDRGDDPGAARRRLASRGLTAAIAAQGKPALGRGADERVDHCPKVAGLGYGTPRRRGRVLDRLLGGDHRRRPPCPRGVDPLPVGHPAPSQAMTPPLLAQALNRLLLRGPRKP